MKKKSVRCAIVGAQSMAVCCPFCNGVLVVPRGGRYKDCACGARWKNEFAPHGVFFPPFRFEHI